MKDDEEALARLRSLGPVRLRILRLRCQGKTYRQIAEEMFYTVPNVRYHMGRIFDLLEIRHLSETSRLLELNEYDRLLDRLPSDQVIDGDGGEERAGESQSPLVIRRNSLAIREEVPLSENTVSAVWEDEVFALESQSSASEPYLPNPIRGAVSLPAGQKKQRRWATGPIMLGAAIGALVTAAWIIGFAFATGANPLGFSWPLPTMAGSNDGAITGRVSTPGLSETLASPTQPAPTPRPVLGAAPAGSPAASPAAIRSSTSWRLTEPGGDP